MLTPRYFFADDYSAYHNYFCKQPNDAVRFRKGEFLWALSEPFGNIYYIEEGISQMYVVHEEGHKKILSFHGAGTIVPGYHQTDFKIEKSINLIALTDITALKFTKKAFSEMFHDNKELRSQVVEWYAMSINLLIYESAHQEYNNSLIKLCNFLYLFSNHSPNGSNRIELTQDEISDILALNRVGVTNNLGILRNKGIIATHRKWIEVIDCDALKHYCSQETL